MTKQEILDGLEGLKDLVNYVGKSQIDALKAAIVNWPEQETNRAMKDESLEIVRKALPLEQALENLKVEEKPEKPELTRNPGKTTKIVSHGTKRKR